MPGESGPTSRETRTERERQAEVAEKIVNFIEEEIVDGVLGEIDDLIVDHPEAKEPLVRVYSRVLALSGRVADLGREIGAVPEDVWTEAKRVGKD